MEIQTINQVEQSHSNQGDPTLSYKELSVGEQRILVRRELLVNMHDYDNVKSSDNSTVTSSTNFEEGAGRWEGS